jgi:fibronectin type 3 domain-containing protein
MKRTAALLALALTIGASPARSQHTVNVTWTASTDAAANPSLTYNVYRASSCPGHFTQLNTTPVAGTSYVDAAVGTGASYCYQVTSVLSGVEGAPSNQATVAIPPPSDRQATCEHHGAVIGWIRCVASRPRKAAPPPQTP